MRAALHAHILCWFERRKKRGDFKPVPVIERTAPGIEPRQRPLNQKVEPLKEFQHDTVYQQAFVGPITAEMVRPDVRGTNWGGYDVEKLRIAGLARLWSSTPGTSQIRSRLITRITASHELVQCASHAVPPVPRPYPKPVPPVMRPYPKTYAVSHKTLGATPKRLRI